MSIFAKRLNTVRRMRGLSQSDLGSKTGLKQVAISFFETGRRTPSLGNLKRLADALEITTDYLMGRSDFAETPVAVVSKSIPDDPHLSAKDVKFLRRVVENLVRVKNAHRLSGRSKSNNILSIASLLN